MSRSRPRKLKRELARILKEQGYIENYKIDEPTGRPSGRADHCYPQVHQGPPARDQGDQAGFRPGQRHYVDHSHIPTGPRWHGDRDHLHLARRDDRPRGQPARASAARSSPTSGSRDYTASMSRIGRQPIPRPRGRDGHDRPLSSSPSRAEGRAVRADLPGHERRAVGDEGGDGQRWSLRVRPIAASTARCTGSRGR